MLACGITAVVVLKRGGALTPQVLRNWC